MDFRVPYGKAEDGALVLPEDADKTKTYVCPECDSPLILKKGAIKRAHFAHRSTQECNGETVLHRIGKVLLKCVVESAMNQDADIKIHCRCAECYEEYEMPVPIEKVTGVSLEHRVDSGRVVDVMLLDGEKEVCGLEVHVTHRVSAQKSEDLSMPWLELEASDILEDPMNWRPIAHGLRVSTCEECRTEHQLKRWYLQQLTREVGTKWSKDYRVAPGLCWLCKEQTLVFDWTSRTKPPRPMPRTVRHRATRKNSEKEWYNTCHACGVTIATYSAAYRDWRQDVFMPHLERLLASRPQQGRTEDEEERESAKSGDTSASCCDGAGTTGPAMHL